VTDIRFGTSGWRAVIAEEFTYENARRVTAAIGSVLSAEGRGGGLVLLGYDTRFMADRFAADAARVLAAQGFSCEIASRPVPTPVLAFEIRRRKAAAGINFTASHNPPQYLGIKFSTHDGAPALPELTRKVEAFVAATPEVPAPAAAEIRSFDPAGPYLEDLARKVSAADAGRGAPHLALDFRYGTSSGFLDAFLERSGARLSRLHAERDPLFGGQSPQCGEKELAKLAEEVRRQSSRLGLATDGDADRFGVLDEAGRYVQPNWVLALLLHDLLGRRGRRGGVARSVATTHALDALAKKFGVPLYETPVGFKFIGELLLAGKIVLGGEESAGLTVEGHVPEKDGILADLMTAEMLGATGKTLAALSADLEKEIGPYRTARVDLALTPKAKTALAERKRSPPSAVGGRRVASVNQIDGLKLIFDDGSWILIRESGTEPVARLYIEARSDADVAVLTSEVRKLAAQ
jgi:phosphoglucomutase